MNTSYHFARRYERVSGYLTLLTIVIELLTFKDQFRGFVPAAVMLFINPREQLICTGIKSFCMYL